MKLTHVEGAVLCGGESTRMGRDKATLELDGVPLALRVANALGRCLGRVRLVAKDDALRALGRDVIVDRHPERAALVGVAAALAACEAPAVLVAACDLPHLDPRVVLALCALAPVDGPADVIAPVGAHGPEPLCAIYRARLLPELERRIARGEFALQALLRDSACTLVPEADLRALDPSLRSFRNANSPDDLR
ncbi:MAG TPA: molybdenum cofactor guanylyltransferase [Myxococcota bacterium]|nr:molybdenum cofactor guanylyltransferase [Myxococcota bacterium]